MESRPAELSAEGAERRAGVRIPVQLKATLLLGHMGSAMPCTVLDLSMDGCRVRTEVEFRAGKDARVELAFRLRGTAFRLNGETEWCAGTHEVGVCFTGLSPRREGELAELLRELAEELAAKAVLAGAEADERVGAARAEVERLTEVFDRTAAREAAARAEAEEAGRAVGEAAARLAAAKTALAVAEKSAAELAKKVDKGRSAGPVGAADAAHETEPGPMESGPTESGPVEAPVRRERRQQARHAVDSTATIFLIDVRSNVRGRIMDVSMSGCRIRSAERFPVGIYRRVEVEFMLDGIPFRLAGVVQSIHDKFTAGVRFLDLSERKREQLSLVIEEIADAGNRTT